MNAYGPGGGIICADW